MKNYNNYMSNNFIDEAHSQGPDQYAHSLNPPMKSKVLEQPGTAQHQSLNARVKINNLAGS